MARWRAVQSFGGLAPPVASGAIANVIGIQRTLVGFAAVVLVAGAVMLIADRYGAVAHVAIPSDGN